MNYVQMYNRIQHDPAMSFWLKARAAELATRDPLDAVRDLGTLLELTNLLLAEIELANQTESR